MEQDTPSPNQVTFGPEVVDIEDGAYISGSNMSRVYNRRSRTSGEMDKPSFEERREVRRSSAHRMSRSTSQRLSVFERGSLLLRNSMKKDKRQRILALHGKSGNSALTSSQLKNLQVSAVDYDIVYLSAPIYEEEGDPTALNLGFTGPFYSWFHSQYNDARFKSSFASAILYVAQAVEMLGPFDILFGFSQGAAVVSYYQLACENQAFRNMIVHILCNEVSLGDTSSLRNSLTMANENKKMIKNKIKYTRMEMRANQVIRRQAKAYVEQKPDTINGLFLNNDQVNYILIACAVDDIRKTCRELMFEELSNLSIETPSMHIIGKVDRKKDLSENFMSLFEDKQVIYWPGGHGLSKLLDFQVDKYSPLLHYMNECLHECKNVTKIEYPDVQRVSEESSMAVMENIQYAHVMLKGDESKTEKEQQGLEEYTLQEALKRIEPSKPLFYNAREADATKFTSYGNLLDFIIGGPGDLRRLQLKPGEVLCYGVPKNGGAVFAMAFLSIMAQTTAVPLGLELDEASVTSFLEQFKVSHMVLFDHATSPSLISAFEKFEGSGRAKLHRAKINENLSRPGWFMYYDSQGSTLDQDAVLSGKPLCNAPNGVGLLLGTSGTTSKPKGVPILHSSLIRNGQILASSIQLRPDDVCYSIMPLYHIGGIAASILCSIAVGASVCCDDEGYNPVRMIEALHLSNPKPTWYSSVPTIHNKTVAHIRSLAATDETLQSYGIDPDNKVWKRGKGHNLRMIRSGADKLLQGDAINLSRTYGEVSIMSTYSMSEQMPISQPPEHMKDIVSAKPDSVGVPVAASLAIVDPGTLQPMPPNSEGEVAISGPTVIDNYLNNDAADKKTYFMVTLPLVDCNHDAACKRFFLTGDVGVLDSEGYLTLKGRNKELIKKNGEQVSPFEIEAPLTGAHPWIKKTVCFAVPSRDPDQGEEVGLAIIKSDMAPDDSSLTDFRMIIREVLKGKAVNSHKWPTVFKIVEEADLPTTSTRKVKRIGLSTHLGLDPDMDSDGEDDFDTAKKSVKQFRKTVVSWSTIRGLRFLLACYVMFMHIGKNSSWGAFNNLRGFPWHVHVFFTLGGFSLAAPMNPHIENKMKFFWAKFFGQYPMYFIAVVVVFINLLIVCRPSTFSSDFHWGSQPDDLYDEDGEYQDLFCEGTPVFQDSYWLSLISTMVVYITGLTVTPFWGFNWWMGFYLWFSSMYYQCLMVYPSMYNYFLSLRGETKKLFRITVALNILNWFILLVTYLLMSEDDSGYNYYDSNGQPNDSADYTDGSEYNIFVLGWYLFSPFWMVYFIIGVSTAFLYDAYRPMERENSHIWEWIADAITILIIAWSINIINQGDLQDGDVYEEFSLRPVKANSLRFDVGATNRLWDNVCGRLVAPLTTLWVFALSTGTGYTARLFQNPNLEENASKHAYNCFLFHQPVAQWYYAATRDGHFWNWWAYRKGWYWFSPDPCPVEWYEYFYVVMLVLGFSSLMNTYVAPAINTVGKLYKEVVYGVDEDKKDVETILKEAIVDMSGIEPILLSYTLDQCSLNSMGFPQLASNLQSSFAQKKLPIAISASDLASAKTVEDILIKVKQLRGLAKDDI